MHHWVGRGQQRAAVQIHAPTAKRDGPTGLPRALDSAGAQRWVGVHSTGGRPVNSRLRRASKKLAALI